MGLFAINMEETPTVKGLLKTALKNLEMHSEYTGIGTLQMTEDKLPLII